MALPLSVKTLIEEGEQLFAVEVVIANSCSFKPLKIQFIVQKLGNFGDFVDVDPEIEDPSLDGNIDTYTMYFRGSLDEIQEALEDLAQDSEVERVKGVELGQEAVSGKMVSVDPKRSAISTPRPSKSQTLRVEVSKINALGDLAGELVIGNDSIENASVRLQEAETLEEVKKIAADLRLAHQGIAHIVSSLQEQCLDIRMVPIGSVFKKFQRVVRDIAKECGKDVELILHGEDTELDKTIVEGISEPLIHLVRNAIDHGIEGLKERSTLGKKEAGELKMEASNEGGMVVLKISDDGKGIDTARVLEKAIARGLVSEVNSKTLNEHEILNFIFHPGFSTVEQVTDTSGRGVGMDVVKTSIAKLNGIITIDSEHGKGTTFTIKLPLTLSIVKVQLVKVGRELIALPVSNVYSIFRLKESEISSIAGKEVIQRRHDVLPLICLKETLAMPRSDGEIKTPYVVEVVAVETCAGIKVDRVLGQQDVVIKNLGSYLGRLPGLAGVTILGNGDVAMILNIRGMIDRILREDEPFIVGTGE